MMETMERERSKMKNQLTAAVSYRLGKFGMPRGSRPLLLALLLLSGSAGEALGQPIQGQNLLVIGHSFFVPIARELPAHANRAGVVGHTQSEVFSGGESGTPSSLWESPTKSAEIKSILDTGTVDIFAMTYDPDSEAYEEWIDYALAANPATTIYIGLPWIDFPSDWTTEAYTTTWLTGHRTGWPALLASLEALYPGVEILNLPYGQSAIELRLLFDAGNLPDISSMTGSASDALFTDYKGHAGRILKDTAAMVWLSTLYGIDLYSYNWNHGYTTDLRQIAGAIMDENDQIYGTDIEVDLIRSTKFMLRDDATPPLDPNKRRFSFRSSSYKGEASGVTTPEFGTSGDPTSAGETGGGATLTLYSSTSETPVIDSVQHSLPASRWERTGSAARPGYRYKDSGQVEGPIQKILLRNGKLSIAGRGADLYSLADAPVGEMVLRLTLGSGVEFCSTAQPKSPAERHDTTSKFNGDKASPIPEACPSMLPTPYGSASQAFLEAPASLMD